MNYQLIAIDMDGTLLSTKGAVSERTKRSIEAALQAGKKIILSTGRPIHNARPTAELLGLDLPLIINNGSEVWMNREELHCRHILESELVTRMLDTIKQYGVRASFWAHTASGPVKANNLPENTDSVEWLQFSIKSNEPELLEHYRGIVESWEAVEISNSHHSNIGCNAKGISKASGLKTVCELLGIPLSQTIAIGDSLNDIPMIQAAGLGVAMGNAQEAVKLAADRIAPTNDEDGVAYIIDQYLMQTECASTN